MKSEVNRTTEKATITYPCLMEYIEVEAKGMVVLFTDLNSGTVVVSPTNDKGYGRYGIGYTSSSWTPANCDKIWKRLEGSVTLSN